MAIGNSLDLKFKITADNSQAEKSFDGMVKRLQGVDTGIKSFQKSAQQTVGTMATLTGNIGGLNATLLNSALRFGAVGVAVLGVRKALEALIDTAQDIGTKSREDFEAFRKSVALVGGEITKTDRALSQDILKSLAQVQGAVDLLFTGVLRASGPALNQFLKQLADTLKDLAPLAKQLGEDLEFVFLIGTAILRSDQIAIKEGTFGKDIIATFQRISEQFDKAKKELEEFKKNFRGGSFGGFESKATTEKDITEAALLLARLKLQIEDARAFRDREIAQAEADFKRGTTALSAFHKERLRIEQDFQQKIFDLFAIEQDVIERQSQFPLKREKEVQALLHSRDKILNDSNDTIIKLEQDRAAAQIKINEEFFDDMDQLLKRGEAAWRAYNQAASTRPVDIRTQAERDKEALAELEAGLIRLRQESNRADPSSNFNIFGVDLDGQMTRFQAFMESMHIGLSQLSASFGSFGDIITGVFGSVAKATEQVLANFILTGKLGGKVFKELAATIIAAVIVESGVKALFQVAEGVKESALAAAATAVGNVGGAIFHTIAANNHFAAAALYGSIAGVAAAAGGALGAFGGSGGGAATFEQQTQLPQEARFGTTERRLGVFPGQEQLTQAVVELRGEVAGLNNKIAAMSPADVLTVGVQQEPTIISNAVVDQMRRDHEFVNTAGRMILGSS